MQGFRRKITRNYQVLVRKKNHQNLTQYVRRCDHKTSVLRNWCHQNPNFSAGAKISIRFCSVKSSTVNVKKIIDNWNSNFVHYNFRFPLKTIHPTSVPAAEKGLKRRARTQTPHLSTFEHSLTPMCQQSNISLPSSSQNMFFISFLWLMTGIRAAYYRAARWNRFPHTFKCKFMFQ